MKAIIQRVSGAAVAVDGKTVGEVSKGFLILLGVAQGDDEKEAQVLADKISGLRVFTDPNDKMNLALADIDGEVLVISRQTPELYRRGATRNSRAALPVFLRKTAAKRRQKSGAGRLRR